MHQLIAPSDPRRLHEESQRWIETSHYIALLSQATEKRLAGNAEARSGDLQRAVQLFTEGIEQSPPSGVHMLYSNRAGARLALGDKTGAVDDANTAAALSPQGFHTAYIRQVCLV